ncbi:MAG: AAA family ATPase [Alphaproteobacteria bacterium]|nr:AAA family ATPase [Alphaproteobacteria bacterium]
MMTLPIEHKDIQALHYQLVHQSIKTISCVGVTPEVGTTSIAYALARRFAASGSRTLLIDLDRTHHTIGAQLACPPQDWTPETVLEADNIKPMGRTGLSILSAPSSLSLHWSFKEKNIFEEMFNKLKQKYDMIVIDAGAVIGTRGKTVPAEIVSSASDVCLPILLSGQTNETDIIKTQKILKDHGGVIQGYVMNDYKNPPLSEELERTLQRFITVSPRLVGKWAQRVKSSSLLSQRF